MIKKITSICFFVFCLIALQLNAQDTIAHKETDLHCTFCTNTQNDFLHDELVLIC